MNPLVHIREPDALLLTWQSADERPEYRTRRVVARIDRRPDGKAEFTYLKGTADFAAASSAGFQGFPSVNLSKVTANEGILDALTRRIPPRKREDFSSFLSQHSLPSPFPGSDFALLAYTGAKLPSDGFAIVPVFEGFAGEPLELIIEVAGLRHEFSGDVSSIRLGDSVSFAVDPSNSVDVDAICIIWNGLRLGYLNRALRGPFAMWLREADVAGTVEKINGQPNRPLVYVRVLVQAKAER